MFVNNPFAELSALISPGIMKAYVALMILLVIGGTLFDIMHKGSAKYFFENWRNSQKRGAKKVKSGKVAALAAQTAASEVLTSSEFCNSHRRIAHLLTMYGFIAFVISTFVMVFCYSSSTTPTPWIWPFLWTIGALMICAGGYWFWFFIRVDVAAEGNSPFRIVRADLFVLSLIAMATMALIWSIAQSFGVSGFSNFFFILFIFAATVLFAGVPWSKFAHMFFKPAAALQKRVAQADGSRNNLPAPANKPEIFSSIRRLPRNY